MVVAVPQPTVTDLQRHVSIAEMKSRAREGACIRGPQRRDQFEGCLDRDDAAIVGEQEVAAAQNAPPWQDHARIPPARQAGAEPAAASQTEGQHHTVVGGARPAGGERLLEPLTDHQNRRRIRAQNRKYRCARGSVRAGSQVNSTPSARTS